MGDGPVVLVVEDEPAMRRFLRAALSPSFRLVEAVTGREAATLGPSHNPELILLDLGLPDGDGLRLVSKFRAWTRAPIIVVSARGREDDKVAALDAGADDYLTKPFGVNELLARMRVALRHAARAVADGNDETLEVGGLRIELASRLVTLDGREVRVTPIEYRLLVMLARHAGRVLTHQQLLREVWGPGHADHTHYLRVYMAQLRRKLEEDSARPALLVTEPGVGYRMREPGAAG